MGLFEEENWGDTSAVNTLEKGLFGSDIKNVKTRQTKRSQNFKNSSEPKPRRIRGPRRFKKSADTGKDGEVTEKKPKKIRRGPRKPKTQRSPQEEDGGETTDNVIVSRKRKVSNEDGTPMAKKLKLKRKNKTEVQTKLQKKGPRNKYKHLATKNGTSGNDDIGASDAKQTKGQSKNIESSDDKVTPGKAKKKQKQNGMEPETTDKMKGPVSESTSSQPMKGLKLKLKKKSQKENIEDSLALQSNDNLSEDSPKKKKKGKKQKIVNPSPTNNKDLELHEKLVINDTSKSEPGVTSTKKNKKRKSTSAPSPEVLSLNLSDVQVNEPHTTTLDTQSATPKSKKKNTLVTEGLVTPKSSTKKKKKKPATEDDTPPTEAVELKNVDNTNDSEVVTPKSSAKKKKKIKSQEIFGVDSKEDRTVTPKSSTKGKKNLKTKSKKASDGDSEEDEAVNVANESNTTPKPKQSPKSNKSPYHIKHLQGILQKSIKVQGSSPADSKVESNPQPVKAVTKKPVSLNDRMRAQLNSARFRYINEQLYTCTGKAALTLMRQDPESFKIYHEGYQSQVAKWPQNPLNNMVNYVKKRPDAVVADFGCGDAQLAANVKNEVHSFDLVAVNDNVIACNMAHVPLDTGSADIAVFCLSLMGTDLVDFLCEANRVLKPSGTLLVAEVVSRFEKVGAFVRKMAKLGFDLVQKDDSNKMFVWFEFKKTSDPLPEEQRPVIELSACIYKKR